MKKIIHCLILVLALMVFKSADLSAANEYFRSIASGDWNVMSTWEMSLNNVTWGPATTTPDATSNFITVRYPNVVTVTANVSVDQLGIDSGIISINTGVIITLLDGSGNDFTILKGGTVTGSGTFQTQGAAVVMNLRGGSNFNAKLKINSGTTLARDFSSPFTGKIFGAVEIDAGAVLNTGNVSGTGTWFYGNIVNNGTLTATSTGGSIRIKGASLTNNGIVTTAGHFYFDTTTVLSGPGSFTAANTHIYGNVSLGSNITYSPGSAIAVYDGAILNPNGNVFTLTSGTMYVGIAEISANGTVRTQNSVTIFNDLNAQFNANLNVNSGTTITSGNGSPNIGKFYGNVTIDGGAILNGGNISGRQTWIYGNVIINGTLTATSTGGSIRLKGPSVVNNGTVNSAGSLFFDTTTSLSGTGSITQFATFSTNANITLNSNHQMHSVLINPNASFNISNYYLKLTASNPIIQNGTFTTTNSSVEYNGTAFQNISTANITYQKLKINNAASTSLLGNVNVNDTLSVVLGDMNITTRILTLGPNAYLTETPGNTVFATTGYITTTRNVNAPSAMNVAGLGAVLTTGVNLGITEIRRGNSVQTGLNGGTSIKRYYDISPTVNTGLNATLVYNYDPSELNGKPESALQLFKSTNSGSTWLIQGGSLNYAAKNITLTGLPSFSRWSADSSGVSATVKMAMQAFYNSSSNDLNMSDTVRGYMRSTVSPYMIVDSSSGILESSTLTTALKFEFLATGIYYLQMNHRNTIETWSKNPVNFIDGETLNYDFTFAGNMAYGDNQKQVDASPLRFAFYSGDVNQDGFIDVSDGGLVDNDAANFVSGYVPTDVNGDDVTDLADAVFVDNNGFSFIGKITP